MIRALALRATSLTAAAAYWPGLYGAATMPRWWAIALGIPFASRLDPRSLSPAAMGLAFAGLAWAALATTWSPDPQGGALELLLLVVTVGVMLAGAEAEDVGPALEAFALGLGASVVLSIPQSVGWSPVPQGAAPAGLFVNSAVLAETAAPVFVWGALRWRPAVALPALIPLILCASRTAALAAVVGILWGWRPRRALLLPSSGVAVVAAGVASLIAFKQYTAGVRVGLWYDALTSITPVGRGLGWWAATHQRAFEDVACSDVLQMGAEVGVAALAFVGIAWLALSNKEAGRAEKSAFAALCVEGVVSFPLHFPASAFLMALLAGHLVRRRRGVRIARPAGGTRGQVDDGRASAAGVGVAARRV